MRKCIFVVIALIGLCNAGALDAQEMHEVLVAYYCAPCVTIYDCDSTRSILCFFSKEVEKDQQAMKEFNTYAEDSLAIGENCMAIFGKWNLVYGTGKNVMILESHFHFITIDKTAIPLILPAVEETKKKGKK